MGVCKQSVDGSGLKRNRGLLGDRRMKAISYVLPVVLVLVVAGCPYSSKQSLDDPKKSVVEKKLLGVWRARKGDEVYRAEFFDFNGKEYIIRFIEQGKDPILLRGFTTVIKGTSFFNLQKVDTFKKGEKEFIFARYSVAKDKLTVDFLSGEKMPKNIVTRKALVEYLEKNMKQKGLFDDKIIFTKTKTK